MLGCRCELACWSHGNVDRFCAAAAYSYGGHIKASTDFNTSFLSTAPRFNQFTFFI